MLQTTFHSLRIPPDQDPTQKMGSLLALITKPGQCTNNSIHGHMPELANPLEHALGWTTASVLASRKGLSVNISVCVCAHACECRLTNTHTCFILLFHKQTQFSLPSIMPEKSTWSELTKISRTMSASPHSLAQGSSHFLRFDYSIDKQNHTYCPVFTGTVKTSCMCCWMSGITKQPEVSTGSAQACLKNLLAMSLSTVKYLIFLAFR